MQRRNLLQRIFNIKSKPLHGVATYATYANNAHVNRMMNGAMGGYANCAEGAGTARDIDAYSIRNTPPFMQFQQFDDMYRTNWMAAKMIDVPAQDMTSKWRQFEHEDPKVVEAREKSEKDLFVVDTVRTALKWAALYGGSAIILGTDDDTEDMSEPLMINKIKKGSLKFLNVVFKDQINPTDAIELDPFSPHFQQPRFYTISSSPNNYIHCSRIIVFYGKELPLYASLRQLSWGDSRLLNAWDILNIAEKTWVNISTLISKANIDVLKIPNYMGMIGKNGDQLFQSIGFMQALATNFKTRILGKDEEFTRNELGGLQGLAEVMTHYLQLIAGAADMPLTRFLGTSVGGFSSGDNEIVEYYDNVANKQKMHDRQMMYLDKIIEMSTFGELKEISYKWIPLYEMTGAQKATIEAQRATRDAAYLEMGVVTEQIVAKQLQQDKTYLSIDDEHIDKLSDDPGDSELDMFENEEPEGGSRPIAKVKDKANIKIPKPTRNV